MTATTALSPGFYTTDENGRYVPVAVETKPATAVDLRMVIQEVLDSPDSNSYARLQAAIISASALDLNASEINLPLTNGVGVGMSFFDVADVNIATDPRAFVRTLFIPERCDGQTVLRDPNCAIPGPYVTPTPEIMGGGFSLEGIEIIRTSSPCDAPMVGGELISKLIDQAITRVRKATAKAVAATMTSGALTAAAAAGSSRTHYLADGLASSALNLVPSSVRAAISLMSTALTDAYDEGTGTIFVPTNAFESINPADFLINVGGRRWVTHQGHLICTGPGVARRFPGAAADSGVLDNVQAIYGILGRPSVLLSPITSPNLLPQARHNYGGYPVPESLFEHTPAGRITNHMMAVASRRFVVGFNPCTILTALVDVSLGGASSGGGPGGGSAFQLVTGYDVATITSSITASALTVAGMIASRPLASTLGAGESIDHWEIYTSAGRKQRLSSVATTATIDMSGIPDGTFSIVVRLVLNSGKTIDSINELTKSGLTLAWNAASSVAQSETYQRTVGSVNRVFDTALGVFTTTTPAVTGAFSAVPVTYDESDDPFVGSNPGSSSGAASPGNGFIPATVNGLPGWAILKTTAVAPYVKASFDYYSEAVVAVPSPTMTTTGLGRKYRERVFTWRLDGSLPGLAIPHIPDWNGGVAHQLITAGSSAVLPVGMAAWSYRWTYDSGNVGADVLVINGDPNLDNVPRIGTNGYGEPGWQHFATDDPTVVLQETVNLVAQGLARIEVKARYRELYV
jgi:hypothetical protein